MNCASNAAISPLTAIGLVTVWPGRGRFITRVLELAGLGFGRQTFPPVLAGVGDGRGVDGPGVITVDGVPGDEGEAAGDAVTCGEGDALSSPPQAARARTVSATTAGGNFTFIL